MIADTNSIIRAYLITQTALTTLIGGATPRIYCPRLPENATLPAVSYFTRGGSSDLYVKPILSPSVQFNCWALDYDGAPSHASVRAREIYRALYDALQGIQMIKVTLGLIDYYIMSAREEVQGQDLVDVDVPNYFSVLSFFEIMIRADV